MKVEKKVNGLEKQVGYMHQETAKAVSEVAKNVYDVSRKTTAVVTNEMVNLIIDVASEAGISNKKIKKMVSKNLKTPQRLVSKKQRDKVFGKIDDTLDEVSIPTPQLKKLGLKKSLKNKDKRLEKIGRKISKLPDGIDSSNKDKNEKDVKKKKKIKKIEKKEESKAIDTSNEILDTLSDIGMTDSVKRKRKKKKTTFSPEDLNGLNG